MKEPLHFTIRITEDGIQCFAPKKFPQLEEKMENEIRQLKNEILCLREAIEWLAGEVANNNNWIGLTNKEITTRDFEDNKEGFYNKLETMIGKEATWQREVTNG